MSKPLVLIAFAVALASTARLDTARADVACSIWEIEASSAKDPSVDPELKPLQKKFKKPPFSSWNVFKRIGAHDLALAPQQVGVASLVHGKAGLLFREVTAREGKKPRVSLGITLDDAAGKRVIDTKISVDAGDYFLVGQSLAATTGELVAFTCRP
jgi:hypothetical protein